MKRLIIFLLFIGFSVNAYAGGKNAWQKYKGEWFDIKYPKEFAVQKAKDAATFKSADGTIEFYVFSPQWSGEPKEIIIDKANEEFVSQKDETKNEWATIKAKNGAYERMYVIEKDNGKPTKAFGFKYKDKATYEKYRKDYLKFKKSLVQYAD